MFVLRNDINSYVKWFDYLDNRVNKFDKDFKCGFVI